MAASKRSKPATGSGNGLENALQSTSKDNQFTDRSAIAHLKELHIADSRIKHPELPYYSSPDFNVSSTNGLTKAVIHFLRLKSHQSERVSNTGRVIDRSHVVSDVMGYRRIIGTKQWIPGTGTNGTADISSTIHGMSVKWEVKNAASNDHQSEAQRKYQLEIERSGGVYIIVPSFSQFLNTYYERFGGNNE